MSTSQVKWQVHYAFFVRSGFTPPAQELAKEHQALLVTLYLIETDMQRWLSQQDR